MAEVRVEGVDFEILFPVGRFWFRWSCLRCLTTAVAGEEATSPEIARVLYNKHECIRCPACGTWTLVAHVSRLQTTLRLLAGHVDAFNIRCLAGGRMLPERVHG